MVNLGVLNWFDSFIKKLQKNWTVSTMWFNNPNIQWTMQLTHCLHGVIIFSTDSLNINEMNTLDYTI